MSLSDLEDIVAADICYASDFGMLGIVDAGIISGCYQQGGVVYASGNGDYAEWLEKENEFEKIYTSDIVGVKSGKISRITDGAEQVMVVSVSPIVLGAEPQEEDKKKFEKIAFMGQVPVKIIGDVKSGDYILPSGNNDGLGIAVSPEELKIDDLPKIVGRSWSTIQGKKLSLINIVVGVKTNEWVTIYNTIEGKLKDYDKALKEFKAEIDLKNSSIIDRINNIESIINQEANTIK